MNKTNYFIPVFERPSKIIRRFLVCFTACPKSTCDDTVSDFEDVVGMLIVVAFRNFR
jgi:hypothetical protein